MPEHFHGIIWVRKRLASPLGEVIRSFKIAGSKANASLEAPCLFDGSPTFWFPGLYDTILFSKGRLKRMTAYILNNAKRRRAVMQNPDLFHTTRNMEIVPGKHGDSVGNHFLLEKPVKMFVQVSRRAGETETAAVVEQALLHASRGGVVVSGCISPGEQAVARAVREAGLPLIAIIPRGAPPISGRAEITLMPAKEGIFSWSPPPRKSPKPNASPASGVSPSMPSPPKSAAKTPP